QIPIKKKPSTKKKSIVTLEQEVFLESLKYMISELVPHCPKEILIEARVFLNNLFIKMKDQFDSYYGEKYTVKERNKVWEIIAKKYLTIFQSLIEIIKDQSPNPSSHKETNRDYELISSPEKLDNSITLNHAIKVYQGAQIRQNWPNPFEIDFLDIKEPNNVATISCRIGDLIIPHAILDTGADDSLYTDNIPKYLGIKIDTKNVHKLTGAVGDSQSIGTSYNIPISIDSGNDSITVYEKEISVIPTKKDRNGNDISIMILGTKWQHHIGWDPIVKGEFIATHNGKTITIPLSTRKESRNAFNTEKLQASEIGSKSHDSENRLTSCPTIKKNA
ncbi:21590_t:CDS:1, partial [Dentiscutata erythropus]